MTVTNSFAGRDPKSKSHDYTVAKIRRYCILCYTKIIFVEALKGLEPFNTFTLIYLAAREDTCGKIGQS